MLPTCCRHFQGYISGADSMVRLYRESARVVVNWTVGGKSSLQFSRSGG